MNKIDVSTIIATLLILIIVLIVGVVELKRQAKFWHDLWSFEKGRYEYYFDGANKRQILDICKNTQGEVGVWFKEDCL